MLIYLHFLKATSKKMITERKALGVATLRFFPKSKGLRPIINLSKQQTLEGRPVSIVHFFVIRSRVTGWLASVFYTIKFDKNSVYKYTSIMLNMH